MSAPDIVTRVSAGASEVALDYPFGDAMPDFGEVMPLRDGYGWTRFDIGPPLRALNAWVVADRGDGVIVVDAGLATPQTCDAWERLIESQASSGRPVRRLVLTHHHPDHAGMAKWVERRLGVPVQMPVAEHAEGLHLIQHLELGINDQDLAFWKQCGWSPVQVEDGRRSAFSDFDGMHEGPPTLCEPLENDDVLVLAEGRGLTVITVGGHSPALACLWDSSAGVVIVGDQVLPDITSGLVVWKHQQDEDLLGRWLASAAVLRRLPPDTLVLPAHGRPYVGLQCRLDQLEAIYRRRLVRLEQHLAEPRTLAECFPALFAREPQGSMLPVMTGEARTYLNYLEGIGRVDRQCVDGVLVWQAMRVSS